VGPPAGLCRTAAAEQRDLHQRSQHGGHQQRDQDRDHHQSGRPDADRGGTARAAAGRIIPGSSAGRAGGCGTRAGAAAVGGAESRAAEPDSTGARRSHGRSTARGNASAAAARAAAAGNARTAAAAANGDCWRTGDRAGGNRTRHDHAGRTSVAARRQREARRTASVRNCAGNEAGDTIATARVDDREADAARNRCEACHADFADPERNGRGADNTSDRGRTPGAAFCGSAQARQPAAACTGGKARAFSAAAERGRAATAVGRQVADTAAPRWRGATTTAHAAGRR